MFENKPETKIIEQTERTLQAELSFPKDYLYFKGHFPDFPLLPGMIQIHLAIKFAQNCLKVNGKFSELRAIKFSQPILPDETPILFLELDPTGTKLTFNFQKDEKTYYSKGQVNFDPS